MHFQFSVFASITAVAISCAGMVQADGIPAPKGATILTVTNAQHVANVGGALQFDRNTLAALGLETIETTTIWTEDKQVFEGVPLAALADLIGVQTGTFFATAINDYTVEIPVADAVHNGPIIAISHNGEDMSVRDKGPLWIIYPYDSSSKYRTEVIYSRSIWQLDRIEYVE